MGVGARRCCSAGSLGNLIDRIFREPGPGRGHVVDFLQLPHWPIFNVADIGIVAAAVADRPPRAARHRRRRAARREREPRARRPAGRSAWLTSASLPVPDGLEGERVDAALARLFGLSRTKAADLAADGARDRSTAARSASPTGVLAGALARGRRCPARRPRLRGRRPSRSPGMRIVHDDDDIVVVDKPVGVAAHPSPGWTGPTVVGGLAAAGYRISTSGAAERQGIVHRLDVGTSGLMVVAKSERAYTVLKRAFQDRTVDKIYHALVQGHPDPLRGHHRRADRPAPARTTTSSR